MQFSNSHLMIFKDDILEISQRFSLNTDNLLVESFSPKDNVIVVESVDDKKFRVHIDLHEDRIIAAKQLDSTEPKAHAFDKYIAYMK